MSRPNPHVAVGRILTARDRTEADERMRVLLARAWWSGSIAGFREGVSDANDDEPVVIDNPYHRTP